MASIAVIRGGRSLERDFSMRSGHHVASALEHIGHQVTELDVDERLTRSVSGMDAAFIALHGRDGEDGTIQSILEALGVAYTGSDAFSCQVAFDKVLAKRTLTRAGIATPEGFDLSAEAIRQMGAGPALRAGAERLGYPIIVKPVAQGSALGLVKVQAPDELSSAVMAAFNYGDRVLLESYVEGTELAVSVLGSDRFEALPAVEIRTPHGIFDFEARVGPAGAEFVCPSTLPPEQLAAAEDAAIRTAELLGMRDLGRVDLIVTGSGDPVVLEVNPCPGLTETSLVPLSVEAAGLTFHDFVARLVESALGRRDR